MDGDTESLLLDEAFSFLIDVRLIRDNSKAVVRNYSTSLIGGDSIRFITYGLFGLFALSTLERDELGSRFEPVAGAGPSFWAGLLVFFNPVSRTWGVGLRTYFLNPISSHLLKFLNLASIRVNISIYTSKSSFTKTFFSFSSLWYRFVLVYLLFSSTSYFPYNCLAIREGVEFLLKSQGDDSGWGQS